MARETHTSALKICEMYGLSPATYPLPLRRTDPRYMRRCSRCSQFIPKGRKSSYCSPCNSLRRRTARVEADLEAAQYMSAPGINEVGYLLATYFNH